MLRRSFAAFTLVAAPLLYPQIAAAEPACAPRQDVVQALGQQYKEQPVGIGVANAGQVVEIFASASGSWSMVLTLPNGTSCMIAAGDNWEMMTKVKGQPI